MKSGFDKASEQAAPAARTGVRDQPIDSTRPEKEQVGQPTLVQWIDQNPDVAGVWVPIGIFVLGAMGWAAVRTVSFLVKVAQGVNKLKFYSVRNPRHKMLDHFFDLYQASFSDEIRFSSLEILNCLNHMTSRYGVIYNIHVAIVEGCAFGLSISMRSKKAPFVFIPFFALHDQCGSRKISRAIIEGFLTRLCPPRSKRIVIFELDSPTALGISAEETGRRKARIRKFREYAKQLGLYMYFPELAYFQPPYQTDSQLKGAEQLELAIVSRKPMGSQINNTTMVNILRFIYEEVYKVSLLIEGNSEVRHLELIDSILKEYERTLCNPIALRQM